ncbi:alpha-1,3-arabinosyltransferase XAT2-like isoform X1 [Senna tora]|uniref:Alpha-1,3-arabinosyltransferase XAT2-like isoform X1 n=1 Tax=Senna tora TaxID=362788 RepID=A0A834WGF9_9FABA|nr:alpha-1,3-arabinosyltransferase XAT2-like isoform X1 [Senna tora]
MYDTIFSRSFNKHEQKKLKYGAFFSCFLIVLSICTVFKPYLGPIHDLNLKLSVGGVGIRMLMLNDTTSSSKIARVEDIVSETAVNDTIKTPQMEEEEEEPEPEPIVCTSESRTDFCEARGDIRVQGSSSSIYVVSPDTKNLSGNTSWSVRPYARKEDLYAMSHVREWSVKPLIKGSQQVPQCSQNHSIPAVLFSTSGYAGNHFHDFTDIIIPLFLTSRKFNGEVQFLITDKRDWWISKYQVYLKKLSNYEPLDIDSEKDQVHCFPSVIVGLKRYQKELSIDPLKYSYSMRDFRDFLRSSYSLKRVKAIRLRDGGHHRKQPRLMIVTRKRTRSFTNTDQIVRMAKNMGFKVVTMEGGGNLSRFAEAVNSCDVLMGVHGAGLTNIVFLPENAIFIQIVPYGGVDWLATNDFGEPSKDMNLKYLEYNIKLEESTLIQQYPLDHEAIKDPPSIWKQGWEAFKTMYLDKQNVNLDVIRFRPTLEKALELLHQ